MESTLEEIVLDRVLFNEKMDMLNYELRKAKLHAIMKRAPYISEKAYNRVLSLEEARTRINLLIKECQL